LFSILTCTINNEIELSVGFYLQLVIDQMSSIYSTLARPITFHYALITKTIIRCTNGFSASMVIARVIKFDFPLNPVLKKNKHMTSIRHIWKVKPSWHTLKAYSRSDWLFFILKVANIRCFILIVVEHFQNIIRI
jgi:hypothetical protein